MLRVIQSSDNPKVLWISLCPGSPLKEDEVVWFQRECASEIECTLLCELLKGAAHDTMTMVRKVSYWRGWKHAKAHKGGKMDWFAGTMNALLWEKNEVGL